MTRLLRFAAAAVLVGGATAVLSACTGDPGPIVTSTPSPTAVVSAPPSPSPTPTVTPEEELLAQIPELARGEDFVSAMNFSRYFLGLYPQLFVREDSQEELFRLLAGANCGFCDNALTNAAETEELGAYSQGGDFAFPEVIAAGGLQDDGYWYIADQFSIEPTSTFGPDGELIEEAPAYSGEVRLRLQYFDDHWMVDEIDFDFDDA